VGKRSYVKQRRIVARGPRYHALMTAGRFSRNGLRYAPTDTANELISDARCRRGADVNRAERPDRAEETPFRKILIEFAGFDSSRISTRGNAHFSLAENDVVRRKNGSLCTSGWCIVVYVIDKARLFFAAAKGSGPVLLLPTANNNGRSSRASVLVRVTLV